MPGCLASAADVIARFARVFGTSPLPSLLVQEKQLAISRTRAAGLHTSPTGQNWANSTDGKTWQLDGENAASRLPAARTRRPPRKLLPGVAPAHDSRPGTEAMSMPGCFGPELKNACAVQAAAAIEAAAPPYLHAELASGCIPTPLGSSCGAGYCSPRAPYSVNGQLNGARAGVRDRPSPKRCSTTSVQPHTGVTWTLLLLLLLRGPCCRSVLPASRPWPIRHKPRLIAASPKPVAPCRHCPRSTGPAVRADIPP